MRCKFAVDHGGGLVECMGYRKVCCDKQRYDTNDDGSINIVECVEMIKLGETNCRDCYYATKINTDTYRCRRKRYDIVKKSCFVPKTEKDREADESYRKLHEIAEGKNGRT